MDLPGDQGSRHVRESGFWNPGNFCLWNPESGKFCESGILAFEIRRAAQRIRNATNDWNLQSIQVSEIHSTESRIPDCGRLGFPHMVLWIGGSLREVVGYERCRCT